MGRRTFVVARAAVVAAVQETGSGLPGGRQVEVAVVHRMVAAG